jgi:hypothetical protein
MAKVRVPKELRPPERFKPFHGEVRFHPGSAGSFRVKGIFRNPRAKEYFWSNGSSILQSILGEEYGPRVILEKVAP